MRNFSPVGGTPKKGPKPSTGRNPEKTAGSILAAALKEFADHGFAGARVDAIARRAGINKRMLYHYFGDKEALFRAVLRKKIGERQEFDQALAGNPEENIPFWFGAACRDLDWVRLLEWEALQYPKNPIIDRKKRLAATAYALKRIRQGQRLGKLSGEYDPAQLLLTIRAMTFFPIAFPQLTRMITGREVHDPKFQRDRIEFLKKFARALRPRQGERISRLMVTAYRRPIRAASPVRGRPRAKSGLLRPALLN
jgi:AcrR family transcriptional regulator